MRHEARFSCMEIYNSKFGGNIYSDFEDKFGAQEVKSQTLQTVCKSELK